ncbi:thioredoxin [Corynebacterium phoceense]|uniref:thioredoxin n=1 Tax=Corynebacterium phoceense TaxID=1686286 RepID=UPI00211C4A5A|nr:thioredoxin [Corynebacterium phoceense]MCQ9336176.1 thioredoxin [Corynebacterium phoceense]
MSTVKNVTAQSFRTDVVKASVNKPVVVDFWAEWCGPCKKLSPMLDEIAGELGDEAEIVKVNVDEERTLGGMFQIMSIPSVLIFRNGEKVDEFVGLQPKNTIVAKIQKAV